MQTKISKVVQKVHILLIVKQCIIHSKNNRNFVKAYFKNSDTLLKSDQNAAENYQGLKFERNAQISQIQYRTNYGSPKFHNAFLHKNSKSNNELARKCKDKLNSEFDQLISKKDMRFRLDNKDDRNIINKVSTSFAHKFEISSIDPSRQTYTTIE